MRTRAFAARWGRRDGVVLPSDRRQTLAALGPRSALTRVRGVRTIRADNRYAHPKHSHDSSLLRWPLPKAL